MLRFLSILTLAAASSGCFIFPDSDSPPPIEKPMVTAGTANETWALEIGQGETEYAPLDDGAHVPKVHGMQGGYHVFVAARLEGPNLQEDLGTTSPAHGTPYSSVYVEVEVLAASKVVSRSVSMRSASVMEDSIADLPGLYAYVDENVRGELTINVKVATDDKTKWASASRQVFVD